jgi:hypothetical protein
MACLAGLVVVSLLSPLDPYEGFFSENYISKFARSGIGATVDLFTRGLMESDANVAERLRMPADDTCQAGRRPHIILVHDESSFDITAISGVKVPAGYRDYFRSFDGKSRAFLVEGAGGPSWYTEYNVITGLSAKSFGSFAYFVTRIAAGRVQRGLPDALRRCGYRTYTLYPALGAFLGARSFQKTAGVQRFLDERDLRMSDRETDAFMFDKTADVLERRRGQGPLFILTYLNANHFPWDTRFRPDLTPGWRDLGNEPKVEEYIRRQAMTKHDYAEFLAQLKRRFPDESFLVVRFGDHQPEFAAHMLDPSLNAGEVARRILLSDPRYLTTYYAIDAINFKPADLSLALDRLDAPYLPLTILQTAGIPLDPSFAEQKQILLRCQGLFYACAGGAEARRFNRLLIDAGLIKGL